MDEYFVHQIPEPLPNVVTCHDHWRESLLSVFHPRERLGDVIILTLAHFPGRSEMDSLHLGRIGDVAIFARHARAVRNVRDPAAACELADRYKGLDALARQAPALEVKG